jgi:YfiH family protein
VVRPLSKGIVPRKVDNNTLEFELYDRLHAKLSVEFDGIDHALFVFADPPEDPSKIVRPGTGVYDHPTNSSWSIPGGTTALRFGPGMHDVGYRVLPSSINKIYIAGGAVVYGAFDVSASNVQITGRGTISGIKWPWRAIKSDGSHATGEVWVEGIKQLDLHCNGGVIEGITFADPSYYSISPNESQNLTFTDIKEVGGWRWNSDGVEPPQGSTAQYVFLHCNDDGLKAYYSDITFRHAVLWKGPNGPAIQTGWDRRWTWNLLVEDVDVIHFEGPQYQGATNNGLVSNQYDRGTIAPNNMHFNTEAQSTDVNARPDMRNLVFRDIRCEEPILRAFAVLAPPGQVMTDWRFERIIMPIQTTPSANNWFTGIYESDLSSYPKGVIRNITFDRVQIGIDKITWMTQTHSTICHTVNEQICFEALEGDGLVTQRKQHALMMMTADCLPVVLGNAEGTEVANLHAGWRGLANGIIENTVAEMKSQPTWAWLGAAISQACFEVGAEVKAIFCEQYPELAVAFISGQTEGKYQADLYAIARFILNHLGVETVLGGDQCSYQQAEDYFSYRRDAKTGRMATFVFMQ